MLAPDQIEKLRLLMAMSGYKDVFQPIIEQRKKVVQEMAFLLPAERPEPYKSIEDSSATSILRGEVKALEWVLHAFTNEIAAHDYNRRRDELTGAQNGGQPAEHQPANPV